MAALDEISARDFAGFWSRRYSGLCLPGEGSQVLSALLQRGRHSHTLLIWRVVEGAGRGEEIATCAANEEGCTPQ